jgi:hypothetical protein
LQAKRKKGERETPIWLMMQGGSLVRNALNGAMARDIVMKDGVMAMTRTVRVHGCDVIMFFPRQRSVFDGGVHKTFGRQLTWGRLSTSLR